MYYWKIWRSTGEFAADSEGDLRFSSEEDAYDWAKGHGLKVFEDYLFQRYFEMDQFELVFRFDGAPVVVSKGAPMPSGAFRSRVVLPRIPAIQWEPGGIFHDFKTLVCTLADSAKFWFAYGIVDGTFAVVETHAYGIRGFWIDTETLPEVSDLRDAKKKYRQWIRENWPRFLGLQVDPPWEP